MNEQYRIWKEKYASGMKVNFIQSWYGRSEYSIEVDPEIVDEVGKDILIAACNNWAYCPFGGQAWFANKKENNKYLFSAQVNTD